MSVEKVLGKLRSRLEALNSRAMAFSFEHYPFKYVGEQIRKEIYSYDPKEAIAKIDLLFTIIKKIEQNLQKGIHILPNGTDLDTLPEPSEKYLSDFVTQLEEEVKYYTDLLSDLKARLPQGNSNKSIQSPQKAPTSALKQPQKGNANWNPLELDDYRQMPAERVIQQMVKQQLLDPKDKNLLLQYLHGHIVEGKVNWTAELNLLHFFLAGLKNKLKHTNTYGFWGRCAEVFTVKGRSITGNALRLSNRINSPQKEGLLQRLINDL